MGAWVEYLVLDRSQPPHCMMETLCEPVIHKCEEAFFFKQPEAFCLDFVEGNRAMATGIPPIDLAGISKQWEACGTLRARYRQTRRLFQQSGHPDNHDPKTYVKEAAHNHAVLKPLVACMANYLDHKGDAQLFSIAQVEAETLSYMQSETISNIIVVNSNHIGN